MIDFRYHLVSVIAIFLALAVGIVVGTTALNGPVLDGLRESNAGLIGRNEGLRSEVRSLESEADAADDLARLLADDLVGGRLAGEDVLLVLAPGADTQTAEQLTTFLGEAGASVTGRLVLQPDLLDPEQGQLVDDLVAQVVPAGLDLPDDSPVGRAAAELAAALLQPGDGEALDREAAQLVVSAFQEAGLVELTDAGDQLEPASMAVLLAAPSPQAEEEEADELLEEARQTSLAGQLAVARELDARSRGAVVAGPTEASSEGGLVRALRSDSGLDADVSTVDNVDRALGQVAVVRALDEQLQGGAGRYGTTGGASAPVPTGAPAEPEG